VSIGPHHEAAGRTTGREGAKTSGPARRRHPADATKPPGALDHSRDVSSQLVIGHFYQAVATFLLGAPDDLRKGRLK
jgi:hypothetical protein